MKLYAKYYEITVYEFTNPNEHQVLPEVTIAVPEEDYEKNSKFYEEKAQKMFAEQNNYEGWFDTRVKEKFVEVL